VIANEVADILAKLIKIMSNNSFGSASASGFDSLPETVYASSTPSSALVKPTGTPQSPLVVCSCHQSSLFPQVFEIHFTPSLRKLSVENEDE
jgi:hypothetical protein